MPFYDKFSPESTLKSLWYALTSNGSSAPSIPTTATPAASEVHVGEIGGNMATATAEFTRPADTTAYAAKDAVTDSTSAPTDLEFTGAGRISAGTGYVTKALLVTDQAANTARFRLHLYNTGVAAINDNSAQTVLYANRANYLGYIDFAACQTDGSDTAHSLNGDVRFAYKCDTGDTKLYGHLETLDAFTPANAQKVHIRLVFDRN